MDQVVYCVVLWEVMHGRCADIIAGLSYKKKKKMSFHFVMLDRDNQQISMPLLEMLPTISQAVEVHAFSPSTWDAEADGSL